MSISKRVMDVTCSGLGLLLLSPPLLAIALAVWLGDRGPVLYRQERVGRGGRPFTMLKFRSMVAGADSKGRLVTVGGDARVTPVGRWIRRLKLDELPQLLNVLKGEMSLVGPRPEVQRYVDLYTAEQWPVLDLVPGITDPASIKYRDEEAVLAGYDDPDRAYVEVVMPDKIAINLSYAARATVLSDLAVILRTLLRITRA